MAADSVIEAFELNNMRGADVLVKADPEGNDSVDFTLLTGPQGRIGLRRRCTRLTDRCKD